MSGLKPPFALTDGERHHPLWTKLQAHFEERLAQLRGKNDGPLAFDQTLTLRGRIECLKEIICLGDEPPQIDG